MAKFKRESQTVVTRALLRQGMWTGQECAAEEVERQVESRAQHVQTWLAAGR